MSRYIDLDQIEFLKVDGNKEFNHGVDCCINRLLEEEPIESVPLDKVKKAREEIIGEGFTEDENSLYKMLYLGDVLAILDKLIESEDSDEE